MRSYAAKFKITEKKKAVGLNFRLPFVLTSGERHGICVCS